MSFLRFSFYFIFPFLGASNIFLQILIMSRDISICMQIFFSSHIFDWVISLWTQQLEWFNILFQCFFLTLSWLPFVSSFQNKCQSVDILFVVFIRFNLFSNSMNRRALFKFQLCVFFAFVFDGVFVQASFLFILLSDSIICKHLHTQTHTWKARLFFFSFCSFRLLLITQCWLTLNVSIWTQRIDCFQT